MSLVDTNIVIVLTAQILWLATVHNAGTLFELCATKPDLHDLQLGTCWLFAEGVFEQPNSFRVPNYNMDIWILVDSLDTPSGPPTNRTLLHMARSGISSN